MEPSEFVALVKEMRRHQRRFFRGDKSAKDQAIPLEREVDQAIREIESGQQTLFKEES